MTSANHGLRLAVHGGAGRESPDDVAPRRAGVERAADAGWRVLARGGSAVDAAIAAVVVLEDDPHFNAGLGSVLTEEGDVECDASVMEGTGLGAAAVGAVATVANPILLAQAVLDEGREVFLVGPPAETLAACRGLRVIPPGALVTDAARQRWRQRWTATGDTVGAVARDAHGRVAAATSTGGVSGKRRGRIGDSAVIGAGTYADDRLGAVSATGPGEAIIRLGLARLALEHVGRGAGAQVAAEAALQALGDRLGTTAGLVMIDASGAVGVAHSTPSMPAAVRG